MLNFVCLLLFLLPVTASAAAQQKLSVFVSIAPQKQFVEKIGGEHVDVQIMLPSGQSPETWSPTPRLIASLSSARIYFQIGVPFEVSWTDSIRSVNPDIKIVSCCDQIVDIDPAGADDDHHDLHIWSSPGYVKMLAQQIRDELSAIDPAHKSSYLAGYQAFITELVALDSSIRGKLLDRRTNYFIVSHAAWGYFAAQYGLVQLALENNGKESGPRTLLEMIKIARNEQIGTVFAVKQYQTPIVGSLARELNAAIIELDPLEQDYLKNMAVISDKIAAALK